MTSRTSTGTGVRLAVFAACLGCLPLAPLAQAENDPRKVGSGYVISFRHLDLDQPADRRALLEQVEQSAARLCREQQTQERRGACADKAIASSLKAAPGRVRRAVKTARLERDGEQQAHR